MMYGSFSGGLAGAVLLCFFQLCGLCFASVLFPRESPAARLLLGSMLGSVSLQWFPALTASVLDFTVAGHIVAVILAALLACACVLYARKQDGFAPIEGDFWKDSILAFIRHKSLFLVLALWLFYCWLVFHSFRWEDGKIYSSQATFGDMSMHLSFITSLARQQAFPPDYSLLPGFQLSYPFLSDSISSSLYLLGAPLRMSYILPMLLAGAQVFFGGWLLLRALCGSEGKGIFAWVLFFFNGGLGIFYFLGGGPGNFTRIFTAFYETPTNYSAGDIRWVNVVVDMLLPQRATLFGWAVLFPTLYLLYKGVFRREKRYFPVIGLLAGALPMIHTHSLLALGLVCGAWLTVSLCRSARWSRAAACAGKLLLLLGLVVMPFLQAFPQRYRQDNNPLIVGILLAGLAFWALALCWLLALQFRIGRAKRLGRTWGLLLGITCLLALPQLFIWTFRQVSTGAMLRAHFAWVIEDTPYLWFYLKNIGPATVLALVGLLMAKPRTFGKYCPVLAIWFLAEFLEFQPNNYDNNKLLYVGFLFLCCAAADCLWRLLGFLKSKPVRACTAGILSLALSASALLTMGREAVASYEIYGQGAMNLAAYIEENVPAGAVILTDQRHNNEVAALAGRNVVCGSPSYLYFHGLPYAANEYYAQVMFEVPEENRVLFDQYHVSYILVSDFEQSSFEVDQAALDRMFPREFDDGVRVLYRVEK